MNKENRIQGWGRYGIPVALLHVLGIGLMLVIARDHPAIWGVGLLAYTLGLRHAFDADHIAAIDNTVRKLVQQNRNPLGVGLYFSLGHSTVVFLMAVATAFSVKWAQSRLPQFEEIGGVIGASVSGVFLLTVGVINFVILVNLVKAYRQFRTGATDQSELDKLLESRGLLSRLTRPLFRFVGRSWHIYPLGFLFGLGFDTASEITLLAISAGAAQNSVPLVGILSFPLLFAAGMTLMDTANGILMTKAYSWSSAMPMRKMIYNLSVTAIAVIAAVLIGAVTLAQLVAEKQSWGSRFGSWVRSLDFGATGYGLVVLFLAAWLVSYLVWRRKRADAAVT
ncbi:HoxN/HupN/NixA family nickel/cobalt transporter [Cohnella cellulosilytica]|uniref:Nickel/cobalt efflux system n=1 Tax=Cohnella cellulosilytica TaxID=986710 RepID=A0ABW2F887_9BACL